MNLFERIKSIFKNKNIEEIKENNLVQYDTSKVFIPKLKDLSEKEQQLVKKYMEEINLNNFETILNYAKELNYKANINTNILIEYLYNLEQEVSKIKLIKEDKELLKKKIDLKILESKMNLVESDLFKIKNEILLRLVSLSEIDKKYNSIVYEFLGIFGEAKRIKHKTLKRSLNDAINRMKINIITMESQRISIDNTINNLIDLINTLNINNHLSKVNNNKDLKLEIYKEKINRLTHIFKILFEEELMDKERLDELLNNFDNKKEQELINRLAVIDNILDKYIYENKDKLSLLLEQLNNLEISKDKKEENLKIIERIELLFDLYKNQVPKEYIELLYEKKFYNLVLSKDFKSQFLESLNEDIIKPNPFLEIINPKEMEIYTKIFNLEYEKFKNNTIPDRFKEYKKTYNYLLTTLNNIINSKSFIWYKEKDKYILKILLYVNHPEFYKEKLNRTFDMHLYFKIRDIDSITNEYQLFEYDSNTFLTNENNYVCFDEELVLKILNHLSKHLYLNVSKSPLEYYSNTIEISLFFILIHGKYNSKKVCDLKENTLKINEGIKNLIFDNDVINAKSSNIVFSSEKAHYGRRLEKIEFPQTLETFEELDFFGRLDLVEEINIPGNFKKINKDTLNIFVDDDPTYGTFTSNLKSIKIDEGVEEIDDYAFIKHENLREVYLPSSLKSISELALKKSFIKKIYYHPKLLETFGEYYLHNLLPYNSLEKQLIPIEIEKSKIKIK